MEKWRCWTEAEERDKVTAAYLRELPSEDWFKLRMEKDDLNEQLESAETRLKARRQELDERFEESKGKLQAVMIWRPEC